MDTDDLLSFDLADSDDELFPAFDADALDLEAARSFEEDEQTVMGDEEMLLLSGSDPFSDGMDVGEEEEDFFGLDFEDLDGEGLEDDLGIDLDALYEDGLGEPGAADASLRTTERAEVAAAIENLALDFLRLLSDAHPVPLSAVASASRQPEAKLTSKSSQRLRKAGQIMFEVADTRKPGEKGRCGTRKIVFPQSVKPPRSSAKALAAYMRVAELSHAAIVSNIPTTKRDIYYKDPALFGTQAVVNKLVDDLAATLEVPRAHLNVRASPRGLFAGSSLVLNLCSGEQIRGTDSEATLVPVSEDIQSIQLSHDLAWVLIVEKEAVFQTLCALRFTKDRSPRGRGLLVTGKGYPDLASRHLVSQLARTLPKCVPIVALMDADPYGIDILSQYIRDSDEAGERVQWIGVWGTEWAELGVDRSQLLPLTDSDRKKALSMLRNDGETMPVRWKTELSHMLFTHRKAEIQILSTLDSCGSPLDATGDSQTRISGDGTALTAYLSRKIKERMHAQGYADDDLFGLDMHEDDDGGEHAYDGYQANCEATEEIDIGLFFDE